MNSDYSLWIPQDISVALEFLLESLSWKTLMEVCGFKNMGQLVIFGMPGEKMQGQVG